MASTPRKSSAAVLFATYVSTEIIFVTTIVSGSTLKTVFALSQTQLGLCLGAAQFGVLVASMLIGPVTHRRGPLAIVTFALAGLLAALLTLLLAPNFLVLFGGLAMAGVCAAALHNGGVTLLSGIFPHTVRRVMAFASALWFGSSVLSAPLIGAWLDLMASSDTRVWGYRMPWMVTFGLLGVCLVLVRWRLRWTRGVHGPASPRDAGREPLFSPTMRVQRSWQWLWILAMACCHGALLAALLSWLSPMAQGVFGVSELMGGALFAAAALGLASGRLLLAAHPLPVEDRVLLTVSGFGGAALLTLALIAPNYWLTLALVGVAMFTSSATAPCLFALVAARFASTRSRIYGYMEAGIATGAIFGAFLVGFLADQGVPLRAAMALGPVAVAMLGTLSLSWRLTERPSTAESWTPQSPTRLAAGDDDGAGGSVAGPAQPRR